MKTKLWTIQDEKGWGKLQTKGILLPKEEFIPTGFKEGYDWMRTQMNKRIGDPNNTTQYPVWTWYQSSDATKKKPDLRGSGHLPRGDVGYRIEIEKDQKDILLSDFVLWHTPLSYRNYIADSEEEAIDFEEKLGTIEFEKLPPSTRNKIEKSWEKVFDMSFDLEYYTLPFEEKAIQATFWELKTDDIIKVDRFIAR
ncbi:DUF3841 domain-containing protein [Dokdonia sp.]|uniref:DUF3841 domain-containing protein n=1 Tax=Dokdonia sp. TaxID=2024995 RepID=UPI0032648AA7